MEPPADRVTDTALRWLRGQGRRPVFLLVHYFDPHWPYAPPETYRALFPDGYRGPLDTSYDSISKFLDPLTPIPDDYRDHLIDRYDGEIRFVDDQIGRLLDGLAASGRASRAWVVVTADHGEEFKDHGSMGHGRRVYEETIRVPLMIGRAAATGAAAVDAPGPGGVVAGSRVSVPVSGIDLFPTITALAGAPAPAGLQGVSLAPALAGGSGATPSPDRPLVCETIRLNAHLKAVRRGRLKLIQSMDENRSELYDLIADPRERRDLSEARPDDRRSLVRTLFSQVDFLSGGWNLRWSGDGRGHSFRGTIRTSGIFRTVVPLFRERGKYALGPANELMFTDGGQTGASGLSFTTSPEDAPVEFNLSIDGRSVTDRVFLGGNEARPRAMPFTLEGRPSAEAAFTKPPRADGRDLGFFIWRLRPAGADQEIVLDDEIRERLRSLGYAN